MIINRDLVCLEQRPEGFPAVRVVVHDQDPPARPSAHGRRGTGSNPLHGVGGAGNRLRLTPP